MSKKKVLFVRRFRRRTGGHVTVHDYFLHTLAHPDLEPYVYFTPDSDFESNDIWQPLPASRIAKTADPLDYDILFLDGLDWQWLPEDTGRAKIVNAILHPRHATQRKRRQYLSRFAFRICNSLEVQGAILPLANGPSVVIPNAIDLSRFRPSAEKDLGSVLIWAGKNPPLGQQLHDKLAAEGHSVSLMVESVPQSEFALRLAATGILVALPDSEEGFYRPGLEGLASGCAVVCSDALGNRLYAKDEETCLQPQFADLESHFAATTRLLANPSLAERIRKAGTRKAQEFTLEEHRRRYYQFLDSYIL